MLPCRQNELAGTRPAGAVLGVHHSDEQHLLQRAAHDPRARAAQAVRGPAAARAAARVDHDRRGQPDALRRRRQPHRVATGLARDPGMARGGRGTSQSAQRRAERTTATRRCVLTLEVDCSVRETIIIVLMFNFVEIKSAMPSSVTTAPENSKSKPTSDEDTRYLEHYQFNFVRYLTFGPLSTCVTLLIGILFIHFWYMLVGGLFRP